MFYSQTYLGRKGPLGTVWCAAHLQHRLRKSHYISTNLLKTIDYIMYPEVPIALRMSGHLLLGLVRIYSKKMDYLLQECSTFCIRLTKIFAPIQLDLPEDARQAPPQDITLPGTFQLDALEMDDPYYHERDQDTHLKDWEEITLIDQVPTGTDHYVVITFDDDILSSSEGLQAPPESAVRSGDAETLHVAVSPSKEADTGATNQGSQHRGSSTPREETPRATERDNLAQDTPESAIMRDAVQDLSMGIFAPLADHRNNLEDMVIYQSPSDKRATPPTTEGIMASEGTTPQLMRHSKPPNSAASDKAPEIFDAHVTFDHATPDLAIRSSPSLQQPRPRPRKRKQFFDEAVVLKNSFMKKALEDARDIMRKRKSIPCSSLGIWKLNKRLRKEQVLDEPVISGISMDLCNIYKDFILSKPCLVQHDEEPDPMVRATPPSMNEPLSNVRAAESPIDVPSFDYERLRDDGSCVGGSAFPDIAHLPSKSIRSPSTRDNLTPLSSNFPSASDLPGETTIGKSILPTPDTGASAGTYGSDVETPLTFLDECLPVDNARLSDIPELNVEEGEDLSFLEAESSSPARFSATQGVNSLCARTRAVAQFLQRHSPSSSISQEPEGLSLNKILEGKKRRLCARMFFETLVLKSYGLVDVQQVEAYGDISLKLTPTFSKADI